MNAKDLTEFHTLVEQFEEEMSLKDICSQEGVDYRGYISWRKRNGLLRSRKATAPAGMMEVEVAGLPQVPSSTGTANVRIPDDIRSPFPGRSVHSVDGYMAQS
ncbi:MAG: hypothetical protein HDS27_00020 [Bacteroides sp.]|nr:hypothetical protein [Bacteroides sp.]